MVKMHLGVLLAGALIGYISADLVRNIANTLASFTLSPLLIIGAAIVIWHFKGPMISYAPGVLAGVGLGLTVGLLTTA